MKISLLRKRENFDFIFVETLKVFLKLKYGWYGSLGFDFKEGSRVYIMNDLINVVYDNNINRSLLSPLVAEFSWHKNFIRRNLQKAYTYFAIRSPFESLFCTCSFYITVPVGLIPEIVIIPGNHSFRIIDLDSDTCFVICKMGFNKEFLINDVTIRKNYPWLNSPKVYFLNESDGYYEEERVVGLPLNRLSCVEKRQYCLNICFKDLVKLYKETNTSVSFEEYALSLQNSIEAYLVRLNFKVSNNVKNKIKFIVSNVLQKIKEVQDSDLQLALTHGDFQPANILCGDNNVWLIDWEYGKKRSVFYDALTFLLESRFSNGLSDRLVAIEKTGLDEKPHNNWVGFDYENSYLYVFLLEDISLKLEEVTSEHIHDKDNILSPYISELYNFLN